MTVYELRFCKRAAFERAFSDVLSCAYVEDCLVDRCNLKLRFRASGGAPVQQLFDRIRLGGEIALSGIESPARGE